MPETEAAIKVQWILRGIVARKTVEQMRQDELIFLGMAPKPKTKEELMNDQITKSKRTEESRKWLQQENWEDYERNLKTIKEDIWENEGYDI